MNNELDELMTDGDANQEAPANSGMISASSLQTEAELANQLDEEVALDGGQEVEKETEEVEEVEKAPEPVEPESDVAEPEEKEPEPKPKENINMRRMREAIKKKDEELRKFREVDNDNKRSAFEKMQPEEQVRFLANELQKERQVNHQSKIENASVDIDKRLREELPDILEVLTKENIDKLKEQDTYFADMVDNTSNTPGELYNKAISAYTLVKKRGIYKKDNFSKKKETIRKNLSKPLPANAARRSDSGGGLSEFSDFMGKTPQEKKDYINRKSLSFAQGYDE